MCVTCPGMRRPDVTPRRETGREDVTWAASPADTGCSVSTTASVPIDRTAWPPRNRWRSASGADRLTVTMRTPGDDFDLARGFLVSEGVVTAAEDVAVDSVLRRRDRRGRQHLQRGRRTPRRRRSGSRRVARTQLLHDVVVRGVREGQPRRRADGQPMVGRRGPGAAERRRRSRPCRTRCAPPSGCSTGRAACTPRACSTPTATLSCVREDVGRHNAVDKVIGWALRRGPPAADGHDADGERPGVLRAGAEGGDGRASRRWRRCRRRRRWRSTWPGRWG